MLRVFSMLNRKDESVTIYVYLYIYLFIIYTVPGLSITIILI